MRKREIEAHAQVHRKWTDAEDDFLREFVPEHTMDELQDEHERRFGYRRTSSSLQNRKSKLGVRSGITGGQFEKGSIPANKGKTWDEIGMPEESRRRIASTQFKKGDEPVNGKRVPIGTERIAKDGYIEVKVKRFSDRPCTNKCWRPKHHLVWEEANGRPVPKGHVIAFADGNKLNLDPDNLVEIPRGLWSTINHLGIEYADRETLEASIEIAKMQQAIHSAKCRPRPCRVCGIMFEARYPHQRTCDECLNARQA